MESSPCSGSAAGLERQDRELLLAGVTVTGLLVAASGWVGVAWRVDALAWEQEGIWRASATLSYPNATAAVLVPVALVALAGLALAVAVARLERRAVALLVAGALLAGLGVLVAAGPGAGTGQDIVVRVTASPEGQAFVRGRAVVSAEAFGCPPNICGVETDSEVIRLRR